MDDMVLSSSGLLDAASNSGSGSSGGLGLTSTSSGIPLDGACCYIDPGSLSMNIKAIILCVCFLLFCGVFVGSWIAMHVYYPKFSTLSLALKADNCSRVNSTLHSIIVVPLLAIGVATMDWGEYMQPQSSTALLQATFCITIAYFMCDTVVMLLYQVPLWYVFAIHHIVALTPYVIYIFVGPCMYGLFTMSCFMLVEFSNIPLNAQAFLEQNGQTASRAYAICFYITFISWIFVRLANPYLQIYYVHAKVLKFVPTDRVPCLIPGIICAYLIAVFCSVVFGAILCKELVNRWREKPRLLEVADHDRTRAVHVAPSAGLTRDEVDLINESPTRQVIYEVREKLEELEHTALVQRVRSSIHLGGGGGSHGPATNSTAATTAATATAPSTTTTAVAIPQNSEHNSTQQHHRNRPHGDTRGSADGDAEESSPLIAS